MKKDFVYFFKHNNINAIKIGKASGESVQERFNSFKTYAPFGAEIIGFFETDNGHRDERELHQMFKNDRLQGEFFDISIDVVKNIIFERNKYYLKALTIFNEWIADEQNDIDKLTSLMSKTKVETIQHKGIIIPEVQKYIKNIKYQIEKWHSFADEYDIFAANFTNCFCSKIAFKRNLDFYCKNNGLNLTIKRFADKKNKSYFIITN